MTVISLLVYSLLLFSLTEAFESYSQTHIAPTQPQQHPRALERWSQEQEEGFQPEVEDTQSRNKNNNKRGKEEEEQEEANEVGREERIPAPQEKQIVEGLSACDSIADQKACPASTEGKGPPFRKFCILNQLFLPSLLDISEMDSFLKSCQLMFYFCLLKVRREHTNL